MSTHAIENKSILPVAVRRELEMMTGGVQTLIRNTATVQFSEERKEPARMFVIDGDRTRCFPQVAVVESSPASITRRRAAFLRVFAALRGMNSSDA